MPGLDVLDEMILRIFHNWIQTVRDQLTMHLEMT